jgi:hypothetical protein
MSYTLAEEERNGRFEAIGHLSEEHAGGFKQMVVLRDKFVVVAVGGFVYELDCGETMDLPNILQPAPKGECRLLAAGDCVGVASESSVQVYTFKVRREQCVLF